MKPRQDSASPPESVAALDIRPVAEVAEYHACEEIQRQAWGFDTDLDVVPLTQLVAASKAGGIVLGAYTPEGELRGFTYGFLGRDADGTELVYSHMTAVAPGLKSLGLGRRLKWAQRDAALAAGIELMVWTYDPLESLNGYFNFTRLGVIASQYWPNLYGKTGSALHRGTPTDRLRADWHLASDRVRRRHEGKTGALAARVAAQPEDLPAALSADSDGGVGPGAVDLKLDAPRLLCEVPADIQAVKRADAQAALDWRMATRELMVHYLARGYFIRECASTDGSPRRTFYVLEFGDPQPVDD
jgi:predicted GNAT superfamily acetyltransferase